MPAIFRVLSTDGVARYIAADGDEITKGEAIAAAFKGHPSTHEEEMQRRAKMYEARHDTFARDVAVESF